METENKQPPFGTGQLSINGAVVAAVGGPLTIESLWPVMKTVTCRDPAHDAWVASLPRWRRRLYDFWVGSRRRWYGTYYAFYDLKHWLTDRVQTVRSEVYCRRRQLKHWLFPPPPPTPEELATRQATIAELQQLVSSLAR